MKKHRFNIFPEMGTEEYQILKNDIKTNGYDKSQPIYTYQNEIIDGWNRYKASIELNIIPTYIEFKGTDIEALNFVMRTNKRRNLTSSQWAAIAVNAEDIVQVIKNEVEKERRIKQAETQRIDNETQLFGNKLPHRPKPIEPIETRKIIAETFNTNKQYVSDAQRLKETKPEVFKQVLNGTKTITEVKKEEKIEARKELIEKQIEDIKNNKLPELNGLYNVVSVDPPWNYGREYDPETSRIANPYPEMNVEEIKNIKLPVTDDSIVFLWTTHKFLPDAFEILKHWGYDYKATIVWNKNTMGMGYWMRMQCEFCLLAVKGNPVWTNTTERDIIIETKREHSRKPDTFFDMVNKICYGKKLEYFSREAREGWDIFGNDINKF